MDVDRSEYARKYYQSNRDKILERRRAEYQIKKKKERAAAYKRKYNAEHADEIKAKRQARWAARNTEEFRAKRRVAYAAKHANEPMTEHRRKCIEAAQKRTQIPIEDRKARILAEKAKKAAVKDMKDTGFIQSEDESERNRETVIKYIRKWTKRKIFATTTIKNGEFMAEADVVAYYKDACKYFELRERMDKTDPHDYSNRNILSYKIRVLEDRFNTLLNKRYSTINKLKAE